MKKKLKQILCAILCHDYEVVEVVDLSKGYKVHKIYNKYNQVQCRCRRCAKTKWMWEG